MNGENGVFEDIRAIPLILKKGVEFYLYVNQSPCGDASIFPVDEGDEYHKRIEEKILLIGEKRVLPPNLDDEHAFKTQKTNVDVQRTGAKVVASSKDQDSHVDGNNYHINSVLRTKSGRVCCIFKGRMD